MKTGTSLPGISADEAALLQQAGCADAESLWDALEQEGASTLCVRVPIAPSRLAELLASMEVNRWRAAPGVWRDHIAGIGMQAMMSVAVALGLHSRADDRRGIPANCPGERYDTACSGEGSRRTGRLHGG